MYRMMILYVALVLICTQEFAFAQEPPISIELRRGAVITGQVTDFDEESLTIEYSEGKGTVRQKIALSDMTPPSAYAAVATVLTPLDAGGHERLAGIAEKVGLYAAAARHYAQAAERLGNMTDDLSKHITECQSKDRADLLSRAQAELEAENFSHARRLLLSTLQRYPEHPEAGKIHDDLKELSRRYDEALQRDAALDAHKKAKAEWERGEAVLAGIAKFLDKAKSIEAATLKRTDQFRSAKDSFENALRQVQQAEKSSLGIRQNRKIPAGLIPELMKLEDEIIDLNVRLRLHVASLHTVRGSYGAAIAWVNTALAYHPTNEQALAARARIEEAAAVSSARTGVRPAFPVR